MFVRLCNESSRKANLVCDKDDSFLRPFKIPTPTKNPKDANFFFIFRLHSRLLHSPLSITIPNSDNIIIIISPQKWTEHSSLTNLHTQFNPRDLHQLNPLTNLSNSVPLHFTYLLLLLLVFLSIHFFTISFTSLPRLRDIPTPPLLVSLLSKSLLIHHRLINGVTSRRNPCRVLFWVLKLGTREKGL